MTERPHSGRRIYVIEALRPGDLRTGTNLYESAFAPRTPHNRDVAATRYEPKSKAEFLATLQDIERQAAGLQPLVMTGDAVLIEQGLLREAVEVGEL